MSRCRVLRLMNLKTMTDYNLSFAAKKHKK